MFLTFQIRRNKEGGKHETNLLLSNCKEKSTNYLKE